jgi:sorting nexin-4
MLGLCDEQIKFYRGLIDNWSEVELKLMKRLDELN